MHIGLVQVVVKPLLRQGVNAPIFMALRDKRLKKYRSSFLPVIQTNVCKGPTFFNCFPDFTVDLKCPLTTEALKLDVHVQGDQFYEFKNFVVIIRVYFRLMSTNLNPRYLSPLTLNSQKIILLQIEDDKPTVFTQKLLKWEEITLPDELEIPNCVPRARIERRDIDQIVEEPDIRVILRFSKSIHEDISIPESSNYHRYFSKNSTRSEPLDNSKRYRFRTPIIEPIIDPPSTSDSGIGAGTNVIINPDFQINWSRLEEYYYSLANSSKRLWFERVDRNFHEDLKKPWIAHVNKLRVDIPFFTWLVIFIDRYGLKDNIFTLPSINVQTSLYKTWHLENGRTQVSTHPPSTSIKTFVKNKQVITSPSKTGWEGAKDELANLNYLKKVHHQVNYTNTPLQLITEQLNEVSTKIDSQKGKIGLGEASCSTHNLVDNISKPFFKMDSVPKQNEEAFVRNSKKNASLLNGITYQLKELETSFKGMKISCVDETCQNTSSSSSALEEEEDSDDDKKVVSIVKKNL